MKYRKYSHLTRIPCSQIGAHPANRDGQGPSGHRCLELTDKIIHMGFDTVEADANGVLVEERPGSLCIHDANLWFSTVDDLLAGLADHPISYGTLSHSTLSQLMRNIYAGVVVDAPRTHSVIEDHADTSAVAEYESLPRIVDASGRLSVSLLQGVDAAFSNAVHGGNLWEILSYRIEEEEPDGCAVIQSALNAKNGTFILVHEMQAISRLMTLTRGRGLPGGGGCPG